MTTKTWKIGECAKGGIITVRITKKDIILIGKEWDISAGTNRGSNQSKAKEWTRETIAINDPDSFWKIMGILDDWTHYGYAEEIRDWIETKITLNAVF